jgi:cysteinyl-tRNA synthetase
MITESNTEMDKKYLNSSNLKIVISNLNKMLKFLGIKTNIQKRETIPQNIVDLAEERTLARKEKDFAKADALRKKLEMKGYEIEDVADGYKLNKV